MGTAFKVLPNCCNMPQAVEEAVVEALPDMANYGKEKLQNG